MGIKVTVREFVEKVSLKVSKGNFGDMKKSIYDINNSGIVDNAEKVNGKTVEENVPSGAVFTDTETTPTETGTDIAGIKLNNFEGTEKSPGTWSSILAYNTYDEVLFGKARKGINAPSQPTVRTSFVVAATSLEIGKEYTIKTVGTTDFTLYGASANTVGVVFTCTSTGTGTGTAYKQAIQVGGNAFEANTNMYMHVLKGGVDVEFRFESLGQDVGGVSDFTQLGNLTTPITINKTGAYNVKTLDSNLSITFDNEINHVEGSTKVVYLIGNGTYTLSLSPSDVGLIYEGFINGNPLVTGYIHRFAFTYLTNYIDVDYTRKLLLEPDLTPPTLTTTTIENSTDSVLDLIFSDAVNITTAGWSIATDGASLSISSVLSGSGTTTPKLQLSRSILNTETLTVSYDSTTGNTLKVSNSVELVSIVDDAIINNVEVTLTNTHSLVIDSTGEGDTIVQAGLIPNNGSADVAQSYELWWKSTADKSALLLQIGDSNQASKIVIAIDGSTKELYFRKRSSSGNEDRYKMSTPILISGGWYKIVITDDGLNTATSVKIYVNGITDLFNGKVSTGSYSSLNPIGTNETLNLPYSGATSFGEGKINLYRQYNEVLTTSEITALGTTTPVGLTPELTAKCVLEKLFNNNHTSEIGNDGSAIGTPTFDTDIPI